MRCLCEDCVFNLYRQCINIDDTLCINEKGKCLDCTFAYDDDDNDVETKGGEDDEE